MHVPVVVEIADALAAAGFLALRFDFGGVGRSEGDYGGGPAEVADTRVAVDTLAARLPASAPVVLAGYSFGAWVAAQAACDEPRVAHVVAVAPPFTFFDWAFAQRLTAPLGIVVGDCDQFCPRARLDAFVAKRFPRPALAVLEGADHFLAGREAEVAAAVVASSLVSVPRIDGTGGVV